MNLIRNDNTYLIRFKPDGLTSQLVIATNAQIHGEHLVFTDSRGRLSALFLMEIVEGWSELCS